ncbi:MAG: DUF1015 domain-containing protein [Nitrospirae bacterium]|nr:DUF1015 domain-containing protein [Nitrospirota bacterium]
MAEIVPFRGILYNVSMVSVENVLAPPYDIITPEYQDELYRKSPYNIVRIDLGKDYPGDSESENRYTRARAYLDAWIKDSIFIRSEKPSLYVYEISYRTDGEDKRLLGFIGLVKLEELGDGNIHPHECTYSKPKQDRLNIMRVCEANTSPIFSLYNSPGKKASTVLSRITITKPYIEVRDADGAIHRLWEVDKRNDIEVIKKELEDKAVFIADGHHRYETALEFQEEMRRAKGREQRAKSKNSELNPWDYVLMFLANISDGGLTILPTHRLIKDFPDNSIERLTRYFEIEPVRLDFDITKRIDGGRHVFGFFHNLNEEWHILRYRGGNLSDVHPVLRELDVTILHDLILRKILNAADISYEMDVNEAINKVRKGQFGAAFFLNPTKVEDVEKAALSSVRMPPKSTYFYPKLLTGIVINKW